MNQKFFALSPASSLVLTRPWNVWVRGDSKECFLDYGYPKDNSKILHGFHRKRMPNSFSSTFFNRHQIQYESGALNNEFSNVYFFLPALTDRSEETNRYIGSINLIPINISEDSFEIGCGISFDPSKLDCDNPDREKMRKAVLKVLKKVVDLSNANTIKNPDGVMVRKPINQFLEARKLLIEYCPGKKPGIS